MHCSVVPERCNRAERCNSERCSAARARFARVARCNSVRCSFAVRCSSESYRRNSAAPRSAHRTSALKTIPDYRTSTTRFLRYWPKGAAYSPSCGWASNSAIHCFHFGALCCSGPTRSVRPARQIAASRCYSIRRRLARFDPGIHSQHRRHSPPAAGRTESAAPDWLPDARKTAGSSCCSGA